MKSNYRRTIALFGGEEVDDWQSNKSNWELVYENGTWLKDLDQEKIIARVQWCSTSDTEISPHRNSCVVKTLFSASSGYSKIYYCEEYDMAIIFGKDIPQELIDKCLDKHLEIIQENIDGRKTYKPSQL